MGIFNKPKKEKVEKAAKELIQMEKDKRILRYFIVNAEEVTSPTLGDCRYIYPKSGNYDEIMGVSNIDLVKEIYAQNGIILKNHVTKVNFFNNLNFKKENVEVLYITQSDISKLSDIQKEFLNDTAPLNFTYDRECDRRLGDVKNLVYQVAHPEIFQVKGSEKRDR